MKIIRLPFFQATLITAICCLAYMIGPASIYETNDDVYYSLVLSGKLLVASPDPHIIFVNIVLATFFTKLYQFFPDVQWFGLFQIFSLCAAIWFINYSCSRFLTQNMVVVRLMASLLCIVPFMWHIQFTKTAFTLALAGFIMLYAITNEEADSNRSTILFAGIAVLFIIMGFLLRKESFYLATLLCSLLLLKRIIVLNRTMIIALATTVLVFFSSLAIQKTSYDDSWNDYFALQKTTSAILDYDRIEYNYPLFQKAGLSLNDFLMIKLWAYADRTVFSKERMDYLYNNSQQSAQKNDYSSMAMDAVRFPATYQIASVILLSIAIIIRYRQPPKELIFMVILPTILCITLIAVQGRVMTRVSTSLVSFLPFACMVVSSEQRKYAINNVIYSLLFCVIVFTGYKGLKDFGILSDYTKRQNQSLQQLGRLTKDSPISLVTVATAFPYENILPFENLDYLSSIKFIWLCGMNQTPVQRQQIARHGSNDLFKMLAERDDFFLVPPPQTAPVFAAYYSEHYGFEPSIKPVKKFGRFSIYKVQSKK